MRNPDTPQEAVEFLGFKSRSLNLDGLGVLAVERFSRNRVNSSIEEPCLAAVLAALPVRRSKP